MAIEQSYERIDPKRPELGSKITEREIPDYAPVDLHPAFAADQVSAVAETAPKIVEAKRK